MNKFLKGGIALTLAAVITLSMAACGKQKKTALDLEKFPLVYADENGLEAMNEGEEKPTLITDKFYTFLNAENKVQAASDGNVYYVQTENSKTTIGDLYAYDIEKKESELIHSGVYSYKVSHDASCIIFSDGSGAIYKYDKKSEKKDNYVAIQSKGVSSVLDISADGDYVLYSQVLEGNNYYTLTLAKTDFKTTEELDKQSKKEKLANEKIDEAPVILCENFKDYLGGADDLSLIYYTESVAQKDSKEPLITLNVFKDHKENITLSKGNFEQYFVDAEGAIFFSKTAKNTKKIADIVTDKYADKDAKLKKDKASKKEWKAKETRDSIREKINTYLKNINTTKFYRFDSKAKEAELVVELSGQLSQKGLDAEAGIVFFGGTLYDFAKAKKPDINKVAMAYKLFDDIKSRQFCAISLSGVNYLEAGKKVSYNSGDCYVDTAAKTVRIIMDFDYLKTKLGTLYTVPYTEKGFEKAAKVTDKVSKVAHFDSGEDNYFVNKDGALVLNDIEKVVLKNYASSSVNGKTKLAFTEVGTGKKDKQGNEIMKQTAYVISGDKALEVPAVFNQKQIVDKGSMFAYYTSYDYKATAGEVILYNGEKAFSIGKKVSMIYKFA
ncbi:MAG: hypothetical protein IJI67_01705 [Clostridia bacterium]|nr:hypothetical protein [Clostridia bacterium]